MEKQPTPKYCPFCGAAQPSVFLFETELAAKAAEQVGTTTLDEHQCSNEECSRSFWT